MLAAAENRKNPWRWLANQVRGPIEYRYQGSARQARDEVVRFEKQGFKRVGPGIYLSTKEARLKTRIRKVGFYFHSHDPNKRIKRIILKARWPSIFRNTFEAAASQERAICRLMEIGRGGGSISRSYGAELRAAQK
jgi:hypothetical protein